MPTPSVLLLRQVNQPGRMRTLTVRNNILAPGRLDGTRVFPGCAVGAATTMGTLPVLGSGIV
jgi:hypothetical protein